MTLKFGGPVITNHRVVMLIRRITHLYSLHSSSYLKYCILKNFFYTDAYETASSIATCHSRNVAFVNCECFACFDSLTTFTM